MEDQRPTKVITKEWVQKSFSKADERAGIMPVGVPKPKDSVEQAGVPSIQSTMWYRSLEEEAKVARLVYAQNEAWKKAEGTFRQSEQVENEPTPTQEKAPSHGLGSPTEKWI